MDCFGNVKRKNTVIPEPDYKELMKLTQFSKAELKELFGRYETIASPEEGIIDKAAFLGISELQCCPLLSLIYDKEVRQRDKHALEFEEFVIILDFLSKATPVDEKAKFLFDTIRNPEHNYLVQEDYVVLMKELSAASQLPPSVFTAMVEQSWNRISKDGKLDLAAFKANISPIELHAAVTVEFL